MQKRIQDVARLNADGAVEIVEIVDETMVRVYKLGPGFKLAEPEWKREVVELAVFPEIPEGTRVERSVLSGVIWENSGIDKIITRDGSMLGVMCRDTFYYSPLLKLPRAVKFSKGDRWIEVREDGTVRVDKGFPTYGSWANETVNSKIAVDLDGVRIGGTHVYDGSRIVLSYIDSLAIREHRTTYTYIKEGQ